MIEIVIIITVYDDISYILIQSMKNEAFNFSSLTITTDPNVEIPGVEYKMDHQRVSIDALISNNRNYQIIITREQPQPTHNI